MSRAPGPPRWSREAARTRLTAIQAAEADAIEAALRTSDGSKAAAAAALGISRSLLYRKMREYRLSSAHRSPLTVAVAVGARTS